MQHTDRGMFSRLADEIFRTGYTNKELAKLLGCHHATISYWICGRGIPNAYYLAKFYNLGCDVIYILTGERTRNDRAGSKNHN